MLNFRKLKKDYSPAILEEGKELHAKGAVASAKIDSLTSQDVRLSCRVEGKYDNKYQCEIEIDRLESTTIDADCDCTYNYDCQHLAAVLFYLEENLDRIIVDFSKETDIDKAKDLDAKEKETIKKTIETAKTKENAKQGKKQQKELLQEYVSASQVLGRSPFFLPEEELTLDKAEIVIVFAPKERRDATPVNFQLAIRLPYRSKPLNIQNIPAFLNAIRYHEPIYVGNKRCYFTLESFDTDSALVLRSLIDFATFPETNDDRDLRQAQIPSEAFGSLLAQTYDLVMSRVTLSGTGADDEQSFHTLPCLACGTVEEPLKLSPYHAVLHVELECLEMPTPKILFKPEILLGKETLALEKVQLFECAKPGLVHDNTYFRFQPQVKRKHLRNLDAMRDVTIPEPLFGTFIENALPEMMRFGEVAGRREIEQFVTLPFTGELEADCDINYLNGELEASLNFIYGEVKVPAAASQLKAKDLASFITPDGILARDLTGEQKILEDLFQGFVFDSKQGFFVTKNEKRIVEFMTEVVPRNMERVTFNCPENLLEQFIYDDTTFTLSLKETKSIDKYEVDLKVNGPLAGVTLDLLWECLASKRAFIELMRKDKDSKGGAKSKLYKILVLELDRLAPVVKIFEDIGITELTTHKELRPLWSLASVNPDDFKDLPIEFSMTKKLQEIQQQMMGQSSIKPSKVPSTIKAKLREYQQDGVSWLERLRGMHLNGILADDMGLGKTLQAITAITQCASKRTSIIVCPTSLVYNWQEEFHKFQPKLKVLVIDGTPAVRKKLIDSLGKYDVVISSYSLIQKDIEHYKEITFGYAILDEAQHIKNRGTRNAKSVKQLQSEHRLILTGTPIENSLEDLWSLFDFLMPGLLSTHDRFVEKYIRNPTQDGGKDLETLRRKVTPFILRRMKKDVLKELPPVSEIVYHCHLSQEQRELYHSYAKSAREELSQLVKKEGFDKVQIHVLATLTRLKQICCHPAIFAKDKVEQGDSAKYEMLMELLQSLIEGGHKTVIFSQYTRMLQIIREELQRQGIPFAYLDGSSKNRLGIVKKFNEDDNVPVFLVSLKAGGTGLNLVGADTVIHYDMWWNPAVESQATDRVHRIGQKNSVSSYKFVTLNTIEEKILELQNRKKGQVQKVIPTDDEVISKLTWEEVLELLQT